MVYVAALIAVSWVGVLGSLKRLLPDLTDLTVVVCTGSRCSRHWHLQMMYI